MKLYVRTTHVVPLKGPASGRMLPYETLHGIPILYDDELGPTGRSLEKPSAGLVGLHWKTKEIFVVDRYGESHKLGSPLEVFQSDWRGWIKQAVVEGLDEWFEQLELDPEEASSEPG